MHKAFKMNMLKRRKSILKIKNLQLELGLAPDIEEHLININKSSFIDSSHDHSTFINDADTADNELDENE